MKKYTDRERLDALNRHIDSLRIHDTGEGFTILTQRIKFNTIEDFCDNIIHHEKFNELYYNNEPFPKTNNDLYRTRKRVFFTEDRELTDDETNNSIKMINNTNLIMEKLIRDNTYNLCINDKQK